MSFGVRCVLYLSLYLVATGQVWAQTPQQQAPTLDPLTEKFLIALASAILSLLTGYILFQVKESREPKKRLSYDMDIRHGLLGVEEQIAKHLSVSYKGQAAENITYVRCDIKNTGNTLIKDQFLRFDFGDNIQILDAIQFHQLNTTLRRRPILR
jgi:hypothetical protein